MKIGNQLSRQEQDILVREFKGRLPKNYLIISIAHNREVKHTYALCKHITRDRYLFMDSLRKSYFSFYERDIFNLIEMFMDYKDENWCKQEEKNNGGIEVQ